MKDALGKLGLSSIQKVTAAIRQLAYGSAADQVDEYVRIGESTAMECLKRFCKAVVEIYEEQYLREPNEEDVRRLLAINRERGFPGMLGSLDCMHWEWKNCPIAWTGQFQGKEKAPTVVLEAIASYDLHIWHAFFGTPSAMTSTSLIAHRYSTASFKGRRCQRRSLSMIGNMTCVISLPMVYTHNGRHWCR